MRKVLFRADSSSEIGIGHIMRDLVLANQYPEDDVYFATQALPGNINSKIQEAGHELLVLQSDDISELICVLSDKQIDLLIIDHYEIKSDNESQIKAQTGVQILCLDDTYETHSCDILLNPNLYAEKAQYSGKVPDGAKLRCGAEYTLLRQEFYDVSQRLIRKDSGKDHFKIFVALGGSDHSNLAGEVISVLAGYPKLHATVVTTTANKHLNKLKRKVEATRSITLHINPDNVALLMSTADLAIVSASSLINEILHFQLPLVAIKTAENQKFMHEYLNVNQFHTLEIFDKQLLSTYLDELLEPVESELIDFIDLSQYEQQLVLSWRNNSTIRKWMFNSAKIAWEDHLNFIESLKADQSSSYMLIKYWGQPIGVSNLTRVDKKHRSAHLGVYARPDLRGAGNILMELIIKTAFQEMQLDSLTAEVFEENVAAINLYKRFHFTVAGRKKCNNQSVLCMVLVKNENS